MSQTDTVRLEDADSSHTEGILDETILQRWVLRPRVEKLLDA